MRKHVNRLAWLMAAAIAAAGCGGDGSSGSANLAPTITDIADQTVEANTSTGNIDFQVSDEDPAALTATVASDNAALVTADSFALNNAGEVRSLNVTPVSGQTGTATITVTVADDEGLQASDSFVLTVTTQTLSIEQFVRNIFVADTERDPPRDINSREFVNSGMDDFADLLLP